MPKSSQTEMTTSKQPLQKVTVPRQMMSSLAQYGESFVSSYRMEENKVDDLKISDYRKMLDDGQIQMLYNAITNTILAAGVDIEDDDSIESEESSEEHEFIEKVLFDPEWKGGMSLSFDAVNRSILRALIEGYRCFEVIWKSGEDGKIMLDKLAPRAGKTDQEFFLKVDDKGNWIGFRQRTSFLNNIIDIEVINNSDIKKVVKATFGEEFGSTYGRSLFKAAWYHYNKAHKGMYLNHVGHELGAVKFKNLKHKITDENKINNAMAVLNKIGISEAGFAANINEMELFFESVSDAAVMQVGKDMIDMHYSLVAKSVLAQFIELGSKAASTGSRALGESQTEFFKQGLQAIGTILIERTWNQVIADLIKVNFNRGIFPKLKVNPISDNSAAALLVAFQDMVKSGNISESVKTQIQIKATEDLGLDVTEEQIQLDQEKIEEEKINEQEQTFNMEKMKIDAQKQMKMQTKAPVKMSDDMGVMPSEAVELNRSLFPDEQKVKLSDIKRKLVRAEFDSKITLYNKLERQKDNIVNQYLLAMRKGYKAIAKTGIELADPQQDKYSTELLMIALGLFDYGKIGAALELSKPVPSTSKADRKAIEDSISLVLEKQENDLSFRLKTVANNALDGNLPENDVKTLLEKEFDSFWETVLAGTVAITIPSYLNRGRKSAFEKYSDDIFAYRYTAVLDSNTTRYCRDLDGKVFQRTDPDYAMLTPPNHYGCRSVWTPIKNSEANGVNVDGKPNDIPVYGSVNSFRDVGPQLSDKINTIKERLSKLLE